MKTFCHFALLSALLASSASFAQAESIGNLIGSSPFTVSQGFDTGVLPTGGVNLLEALLFSATVHPSATPASDIHYVDAGPTPTSISDSDETFSLSSAPVVSGIDPSILNFVADPDTSNTVSGINVPAIITAVAVEPSTLLLLGTGMLSAAAFYLRRRTTL
jgi:hypothetical protein